MLGICGGEVIKGDNQSANDNLGYKQEWDQYVNCYNGFKSCRIFRSMILAQTLQEKRISQRWNENSGIWRIELPTNT